MAVRLTRPERKAQTRALILESARSVFLRSGFHGASLDEIAEEAGFTKGAVYSNFEGKDELFLALLDVEYTKRLAAYTEAVIRADGMEGALRANARLMAETARREPRWAPLLVEFWTHASRDPVLRTEAAARHDRVLDAISEIFTDLAARLGTTWAIPPRELVRGASAFARGMALERLLDPDAVDPEIFEELFLVFVNAHLRPAEPKGALQ